MRSFDELLRRAQSGRPSAMAVAQAADPHVLEAVVHARGLGLVEPILVGRPAAIEGAAERAGLDLRGIRLVAAEGAEVAATAVRLVALGEAELLMKGLLPTADLLRAALDREGGLRTGRLLSHVCLLEPAGFGRLLLVTDVAMVVAPDLAQKVEILKNAIAVASVLRLGQEPLSDGAVADPPSPYEPRVALLAAVEVVNADMPATVDAALITRMAERGQIQGAIVDGPLALDNAISFEAAKIKGIKSPVAGRADVLVVPDIEAGNMLYKSLVYFAAAKAAGVVVGARVPIVLLSRADDAPAKLYSIALARVLASGGNISGEAHSA